MLRNLGENGVSQGKFNISFLSMFLLGDLEKCMEILIQTNRIPEAAFFARTYMPNKVSYVLDIWRTELAKINEKAGQSLADPQQYENLFPGFYDSIKTQQFLLPERSTLLPAQTATDVPLNSDRDPIEEMKKAENEGRFDYDPSTAATDMEGATSTATQGHKPSLSNVVEETLISTAAETPATPDTVGNIPLAFQPAPPAVNQIKRKSSLEDFESEIEALNLDDNIDTSDVNIDDDLLSD